jgi:hypothetical protein
MSEKCRLFILSFFYGISVSFSEIVVAELEIYKALFNIIKGKFAMLHIFEAVEVRGCIAPTLS